MTRAAVLSCVLLGACGGAPSSCPPAHAQAAPSAPARRPAPAPSPPAGSVAVRPITVQPSPEGFILLLGDPATQRVLPVVIGPNEAEVIDLRMRGEHFPRPLTHDLLDSIVHELGGELVFVHIDKLRDGAFIGSLHIWDGHRMHTVDSRTSDAVAVALGEHAPIYVASVVLEEAGEQIPSDPDEGDEGF
jgi:bifunctional DNase/RNase